jgi:alpha-beta hydrolase superfamily lysophospholipase
MMSLGDGGARPLASIPFDEPRPLTARDVWSEVKQGLDFVAHNIPRAHALLVRLNPYPAPWRAETIVTPDGARLSAWHGAGRPGGPAVLMVPGTFQTKDDTPRKRRAMDLWRRLGAHVLIVDLRGFGGSHAYPGSGGFLEARDLLAAADWLRSRSGREKVFLWGESLGGAVTLLSASLPGAPARYEGVLAWAPFADLGDAIRAGSASSRRGQTLMGRTYRWLIRRRTRNEVADFGEYLRQRARDLNMPWEELVAAGSPCFHMEDLQVPATVFHAVDDPIVPVTHARLLARAAERAPRLSVHVLPRGRHLEFDRVAPEWYRATTTTMLRGAVLPS